jgi:PAS domain S-box-containing protein
LLVAVSLASTLAWSSGPSPLLAGAAYLASGLLLLRLGRAARRSLGQRCLAAAFLACGAQQLHRFALLLLPALGAREPGYAAHLGELDLLLLMSLGLALLAFLLEGERERALALLHEKRRAESDRAQATRFTDELVKSAGEGIIAYDRQLRYELWNPFMEQLTNVPASEVLGRSLPEAFPQLAEHGLHQLLQRALAGEVVVSTDVPYTARLTGRSGWTSATYAPRRGTGGEITGVIVVVRDVTDRKLAERALKDSEERYRYLFENNPQPMFVFDTRSLAFLAVNDAALALYGYQREEFLSMNVSDLEVGPPTPLPELRERIGRLPAYHSAPNPWKQRRKDGSMLDVEIASHQLSLGEWSARVVMLRDVTDRVRGETERARLQRALEHAAAEWKGTFDAIEAPVVLLDPGGRITRLNRAALEQAGGRWEASVGVSLRGLGSGEPWASAATLAAAVSRHGGALSQSAKDAESGRTWAVSASRFESPEVGEARVLVAARAITEIVRLEETLRRKETMSAMGSLVAGVAHEVRNPLFGISSTLDAFEARFGRAEQFQRYLETLRGQVERLGELMNELLEYGRPPAAELQPVALSELLRQAVAGCDSLARRAQVEVSTRVTPSLPPTLADRKRLVQVFQNIVDNAIRHTPAGGRVLVTGELHAEGEERWLRASVRDTGPGFEQADLPRVFEPFFTRRRGGTGLGLSIVQRIVEQHGGRLQAENHPQGGALVTVMLRAVDEARLAAGY